jgi:hypothetical protein
MTVGFGPGWWHQTTKVDTLLVQQKRGQFVTGDSDRKKDKKSIKRTIKKLKKLTKKELKKRKDGK